MLNRWLISEIFSRAKCLRGSSAASGPGKPLPEVSGSNDLTCIGHLTNRHHEVVRDAFGILLMPLAR